MLVVMGSGGETARETVAFLQARGERVGVAQIRLYRPFPARELAAALPQSVRRVAVLDRTKEPGSFGEPLFLDVLAALTEAHGAGERERMPAVIGGRYGLSSKEFTPGMVAGVLDELGARAAQAAVHDRDQRRRVSARASPTTRRSTSSPRRTSAPCSSGWARTARSAPTRTRSRSSATRRTCRPRATSSTTPRSPARRRSRTCASGRSRSMRRTWSSAASFVGCHQFGLIERDEVLDRAAPGATLLLNCRHEPDQVWDALSRPVQEKILAKEIKLYAIDAGRIAREAGLAGRTNTVLQTCFFAISGVMERDRAIEAIKASIREDATASAARRWSSATRGGRPLDRGAAPGPGPRSRHLDAASAPGARAGGRARVRADRDRGDDGRSRR